MSVDNGAACHLLGRKLPGTSLTATNEHAVDLSTVEVAGMILVRWLTSIVGDGVATHLLYPVFLPDRSAGDVLEWFRVGAKVEPASYEVEYSAHGPSNSPGNLDASS